MQSFRSFVLSAASGSNRQQERFVSRVCSWRFCVNTILFRIHENFTNSLWNVSCQHSFRLDSNGVECGLNLCKSRHLKWNGRFANNIQNWLSVFFCGVGSRFGMAIRKRNLHLYIWIGCIARISFQLHLGLLQINKPKISWKIIQKKNWRHVWATCFPQNIHFWRPFTYSPVLICFHKTCGIQNISNRISEALRFGIRIATHADSNWKLQNICR
jgi:hypothetical protein